MTVIRSGGIAAGAALLALCCTGGPTAAQTPGGTLRVYHRDSPPGASIHEEATISTLVPFMAVYNNLVMYKQDEPQNSLESIVPDLAKSWSWNDDRTKLTFKLHEGVTWHDGKPFTSRDVKCTWDMLTEKSEAKFRKNPRQGWYHNLQEVTLKGEHEATFHLKRPQPAFLALLAAGFSPVYPCHVSAAIMRSKPIGTGPFKVADFNPNVSVKLVKNADYWKKGRPYLDAIEYTVIKNRSTAILSFIADEFDLTFPGEVSVPLLRDIRSQAPRSVCELRPTNVGTNLIINPEAKPFDNREVVRALMLAIDRKAFIDILYEGKADIGGAMLPQPEGVWGLPLEYLKDVPGYSGDVEKNREEARAIMRKLGYGPDKRLPLKLTTRNVTLFRDPAVVMLGQLREIYIDAELDLVETANYAPKMTRKDFTVSAGMVGSGLDEPDQQFYENYACGSERNIGQYCNPELDKLIDQQSMELDPEKRKKLVWEIDRKLQLDGVRPIIAHYRAATCWHPRVKGLTVMVNSLYNGWRFEDIWLER